MASRPLKRLALVGIVLVAVFATRVRAELFNGISPWLFLLIIAATSFFIVEIVLPAVAKTAITRARIRLLVGTTLLMLFVAEAAFRYATVRWATYMERNGSAYFSLYRGEPTWFHTYWAGHTFQLQKVEFLHVRDINSLGLPDKEFTIAKAPHEYRILALGDSFTEGVGTSADTTWVKVAQASLAQRYPSHRVNTLNAGVSGSDPYFEHMLLKEKLQPFHPDLVIVAINTSDLNEAITRGGSERFRPDGTVAYAARPSWDWLYGVSYIFRAFIHDGLGYNSHFVKNHDAPAREREAARVVRLGLETLRDYCRAQGMGLLVVSHPQQSDLERGNYDRPDYDELMQRLAHDPNLHFVDLLKYYTQHGLMTKETAPDLYWPIDYHHNTQGYRIMGEAIAANVVELGFIKPEPDSSP